MVSIHGPLGYEPNTLTTAPLRCWNHWTMQSSNQHFNASRNGTMNIFHWCACRESNPGHKHGRHVWYRYTTCAVNIRLLKLHDGVRSRSDFHFNTSNTHSNRHGNLFRPAHTVFLRFQKDNMVVRSSVILPAAVPVILDKHYWHNNTRIAFST